MPPTACFLNIVNPIGSHLAMKKWNLSTLRSGGHGGLEIIFTPHLVKKVVVNSRCSDWISPVEQDPVKIIRIKVSDGI